MTDYTPIPDARLEPQKPVRSVDALALRDNPIAITEGSAGAPKIQTAAIADGAVTEVKIGAGEVTQSRLATTTNEQDLTQTGGGTAESVENHGGQQYVFGPLLKYSKTGSPILSNWVVQRLQYISGLDSDLTTNLRYKLYMKLVLTVSTGSITITSQVRYITASRDCPTVWLAKKKGTNHYVSAAFRGETAEEDLPWSSLNGKHPTEDHDIYVMELKRSSDLCEHLWNNFNKATVLEQIRYGILTKAIVPDESRTVKPLSPRSDKKYEWLKSIGFDEYSSISKSTAVPALYLPGVKVVDFSFDKSKV